MFEPEVLRKQTYCTEEVLVTLLGGAPAVIRCPIVIRRLANCAHLPPLVTPLPSPSSKSFVRYLSSNCI